MCESDVIEDTVRRKPVPDRGPGAGTPVPGPRSPPKRVSLYLVHFFVYRDDGLPSTLQLRARCGGAVHAYKYAKTFMWTLMGHGTYLRRKQKNTLHASRGGRTNFIAAHRVRVCSFPRLLRLLPLPPPHGCGGFCKAVSMSPVTSTVIHCGDGEVG